jgi:hypothetical protein
VKPRRRKLPRSAPSNFPPSSSATSSSAAWAARSCRSSTSRSSPARGRSGRSSPSTSRQRWPSAASSTTPTARGCSPTRTRSGSASARGRARRIFKKIQELSGLGDDDDDEDDDRESSVPRERFLYFVFTLALEMGAHVDEMLDEHLRAGADALDGVLRGAAEKATRGGPPRRRRRHRRDDDGTNGATTPRTTTDVSAELVGLDAFERDGGASGRGHRAKARAASRNGHDDASPPVCVHACVGASGQAPRRGQGRRRASTRTVPRSGSTTRRCSPAGCSRWCPSGTSSGPTSWRRIPPSATRSPRSARGTSMRCARPSAAF